MTRETSIDAYNKIQDSGLLTKARFAVYKTLFHHGPLTAGEIFEISQDSNEGHTIVKGSICARLTELQRQGVIQEIGVREWKATGQSGILWDVTSNLPTPLTKKPSKDQIIKDLMAENKALKNEIWDLRHPNIKNGVGQGFLGF